MNAIFLPELLAIEIKNFTLYPNGLDFKHDFIKGINMIVGGNGMGKTTLVNIIKYALIGHYKEEYDYTRSYKGNRIEKRISNPWAYFSKRDVSPQLADGKPFVRLFFRIKNTEFEITRCLENIEILEAKVAGESIKGEPLSQKQFDLLSYEVTREKNDTLKKDKTKKIEASLPFKFEKAVENSTNVPFDDLIFFVNKILFFGEDHKTILWNDNPENDVQMELFNKYFNDSELNRLREETKRQAKYYDTQARHKSEDIRVINGLLDKVKGDDDSGQEKNEDEVRAHITDLRKQIETLTYKIDQKQEDREKYEKELKILNNSVNELSQRANVLEADLNKHERDHLLSKWVTLHSSYEIFEKSLKTNSICPMCSQDVPEKTLKSILDKPADCILCGQEIIERKDETVEKKDSNLKNSLNATYEQISTHQKKIYTYENTLEKLDQDFNDLAVEKRRLSSELRKLEYDSINDDGEEKITDLTPFYDELDQLELDKEKYHTMSRECREKVMGISERIEGEIVKNALRFSSLFAGYAGKFLGVECSLTFDNLNGQRRFYPVIDGAIREQEEELSESQRFFVDHSFRMSILSFFYNRPSFYIVETPDSSLDISYERNAADVFIKFLANPYSLIITTNLNNSEFLDYLVKSYKQISIINLLDIARKSSIQTMSKSLKGVFNKLKKGINGK
ncbi:MAG: AAA family ATPase [Bacteroidota bacterium]